MKLNQHKVAKTDKLQELNSMKPPFLILITILLAVNLILIVFSAAVNNTVLNPDFVENEFVKYSFSGGGEEISDVKEVIGKLMGASGLFYFVFYLLVIFSLILSLFIFLISYRSIVKAFVCLASAAVSASVLSYFLSILAFKLTSDRLYGDGGVLSGQVTTGLLSGFTGQVTDYSIILLFTGLMFLVLAYISHRMFKFLETP